jgi:hypothetical protein
VGHQQAQNAIGGLRVMGSLQNLGPFLASRETERERLCKTLARAWIPPQVDPNDDFGKDSDPKSELRRDWNPESHHGATRDVESVDPAGGT